MYHAYRDRAASSELHWCGEDDVVLHISMGRGTTRGATRREKSQEFILVCIIFGDYAVARLPFRAIGRFAQQLQVAD